MLTAQETDGKSYEYRGTQSVEIVNNHLAGLTFPAVYLNDAATAPSNSPVPVLRDHFLVQPCIWLLSIWKKYKDPETKWLFLCFCLLSRHC